jgi:chromosomal replication initiator protein
VDASRERRAVGSSSKLEYLKGKLKELAASPAWAGQIAFYPSEGNRFIIEVRNRFVRDWVRENYLPPIEKEWKALPGEEISIQFVVSPSDSGAAEPVEKQEKFEGRTAAGKNLFHDALKPKYAFANFVVGASNQFAHAAARAVAQLPAQNYNPLFIYGGVGLGKTHLLNAIGLEALKNFPQSRIIYISSEKFMNELIHCLRFQKMAEFRTKYRDGCDLLLMDDVQFIAGKERTQEEFFHTFNHLHDAQKQIVLTSDKPPREIPGLEERLRSRFEWGLIADIQVPDLETRMAILKRKADDDGIRIDDEVTLFLATNIKSNVRELEGSLIRVNALASLNGVPITVDFAKDVLKNVLGMVDHTLTIEQIQKVVSEFYKIKLSDLLGKRRMKSLALPRQIAMYLCRKHVNSSYPEIGQKFGGKDHSTVVHAFTKIEKILESDRTLQDQIYNLEQSLAR